MSAPPEQLPPPPKSFSYTKTLSVSLRGVFVCRIGGKRKTRRRHGDMSTAKQGFPAFCNLPVYTCESKPIWVCRRAVYGRRRASPAAFSFSALARMEVSILAKEMIHGFFSEASATIGLCNGY